MATVGRRLHTWAMPGFRRGWRWRGGAAVVGYGALGALALLALGSPVGALVFVAATAAVVGVVADYRSGRRRHARPFRSLGFAVAPGAEPAAHPLRSVALWSAVAGLFLAGCLAWAAGLPGAWQRPSAPPAVALSGTPADVPEAIRQDAVRLLAAAGVARREGDLGIALELARQAQGEWPAYADAEQLLVEVAPQATAQATVAIAQATAAAQAQASVEARARIDAAAAAQAGRVAVYGYATKLTRLSSSYGETLGRLAYLSSQAGARPLAAGSSDWQLEAAAALASLQGTAGEMAAIAPVPPEMAPVADLMRQLNGETVQLSDDLARGLNDRDAVSLASAAARIEQIKRVTGQATEEMSRFVSSR